jgi:LAGLIDADG DNA endonuclease family
MDGPWENTSASFKAMMIGKLLGDGGITVQKGRKPRFNFLHTTADVEWVKYCYEQLSSDLPLASPKYKKTNDPRLIDGFSTCYYVQSRTSEIITYLREAWYKDSRKVIPTELIEFHFNEQSLAWWYMDDGHLKVKENIPQKIVFSTESFTNPEIYWLIDFLFRKYSLTFRIDSKKRIVLYEKFQIYYFLNIISPYIHPSMHRKQLQFTHLEFNLPSSKRTTIYLSSFVLLKLPTKEINTIIEYGIPKLIASWKNNIFYHKYLQKIVSIDQNSRKGYQIVLTRDNLSKLSFLHGITGLQFSIIVELCFNCREISE